MLRYARCAIPLYIANRDILLSGIVNIYYIVARRTDAYTFKRWQLINECFIDNTFVGYDIACATASFDNLFWSGILKDCRLT